jgi:hypothetical protein
LEVCESNSSFLNFDFTGVGKKILADLVCLRRSSIFSSSLPAMAAIMEIIIAPLKIFEGLGLSPFQAFVVIGMLTSGAIMNWTFNHSSHDDDDSDHEE